MKLDSVVALILVLLEIGSFLGVIFLCMLLIKFSSLRDSIDIKMPRIKRPKKKHKIVNRTEEQEAELEDEKDGELVWR